MSERLFVEVEIGEELRGKIDGYVVYSNGTTMILEMPGKYYQRLMSKKKKFYSPGRKWLVREIRFQRMVSVMLLVLQDTLGWERVVFKIALLGSLMPEPLVLSLVSPVIPGLQFYNSLVSAFRQLGSCPGGTG